MAKKTLTNLFEICENVWNEVDSFCGDISVNERAVIFGAVRQRLAIYRRPEVTPVIENVVKPVPEKKKVVCKDEFDAGKDSKCLTECKENSPEDYEKCLEKFQDKVSKKANAKKKEKEPVEDVPAKKGRTFDKDFWGFDKKAITGKINEMVSKKFCTKTEIAEALGIDGKRVAVHFSNLKTSGHIMKKKKKDGDVFYKLTKEVSE